MSRFDASYHLWNCWFSTEPDWRQLYIEGSVAQTETFSSANVLWYTEPLYIVSFSEPSSDASIDNLILQMREKNPMFTQLIKS